MEKFSFIKNKTEDKQENALSQKIELIKDNNAFTFEDWSKKDFDDKKNILIELNATAENFSVFDENNLDEINNKITPDNIDKKFDFFMRVISFPGYKKMEVPDEKDDNDVRHEYPEELLNLSPEILECLKKEEEFSNLKNEWILSPIDVLKNNDIKNLSDWYSKSIDEKRKILMSSESFMGVDVEVEKGKIPLILKYGKKKYNDYLDNCFLATIERLSEVLRYRNKTIKETLNKDELFKKARLNQLNKLDESFKNKASKYIDNKLSEEIPDMANEEREKMGKDFKDGYFK